MLKSSFPLSFHSIQKTARDARPTNERPVKQPNFSQKALHTGLISSQNGNLLWLTISQERLNSISDGATTSHLSTNTFWSIQTIIQNIGRRLSNPIFAMKAKFSLRSRQEFLHHQARFRRSISNSCVSTNQTLQDGETSSSNSKETLIP